MIDIKYKNGYPTQKCINELIKSFFGETIIAPRISTYGFNGKLIWDRAGLNEKIDSFSGFLNENGIQVRDYRLYESPYTGYLQLEKKIK